MKLLSIIAFLICSFSCAAQEKTGVSLLVLGTAQDGGSPHVGCSKDCCSHLFTLPDNTRKVVSLGIIDHNTQSTFLFEATPDLPAQLKQLQRYSNSPLTAPNGIFLTHAHMGHYTGLMYLGREALGASQVPVYAMPQMALFLKNNGPWSQLVNLNNIVLKYLLNNTKIQLTKNLSVSPFTVPHRDEYSETVGFEIVGPNASVLFIPDIDKWEKWSSSIVDRIQQVDYAFLDATFYDSREINNRDITEIPHPFVIESMQLFSDLSPKDRSKIHFIHFNHTNPLWNERSQAHEEVLKEGYQIAKFMQEIKL